MPETLQMLVREGEGAAVAEILQDFQTDTAQRLDVLRQALAERDSTRVKAQAHAIKGSAGQIGASSLAALCQRIELESRSPDCQGIHELLERAEADFAGVCLAIAG